MKFLCLPGAYGSASNFAVQLGPFAEHMNKERGLATFTYTQGAHEVDPPVGWEHYFGARPFYRFLNSKDGDAFETLRRVKQLPRGLTPEETLRLFQEKDKKMSEDFQVMFREALDRIHKTIDEDPEIDAILGYSEGAMMAATILYEQNERWLKHNIPKRIKFAIFFSGTPPIAEGPDGLEAKLADQYTNVIDIPTFHVFGSNDPLMYSAVALYNVCNQETAEISDHGLGHLVPRDVDTVRELADALEGIIEGINRSSTAGTETPNTDYTDFSESDRSDKQGQWQ